MLGAAEICVWACTGTMFLGIDIGGTFTDVVLEIGCEWGTTTTIIAEHCREVIGTDISPDVIARAREMHPGLQFDVLDAFDVRAALDLGKDFTKIYIDMSGISGYRSLLDVISLLTMYATVLRPEAIVIKSGALKHFASLCIPWRGEEKRHRDDTGA